MKRCIICNREFESYSKSKKNHAHNHRNKYKRPARAITCSRECSRKYNKIYEFIIAKYRKTKKFKSKKTKLTSIKVCH